MIYFDNSATTPISPQALDTYVKMSQRFIGNPSSLHRLGQQGSTLLEKARKQISDTLAVSSDEIYFTSGGTEGNNWILKGTAIEKRMFGKHMIISSVEHPSVSETAKQLESLGFDISVAPVTSEGLIDVESLKLLIRDDTILVSTVVVNSEVGIKEPVKAISELLEDYPSIHYHVDAVQSITKVDVSEWLTTRVDFATFSAHKFQGPRGVGFIYWKKGNKLAALLNGGGQEKNKRSGTENLPGIVASAKALRLANEDADFKNNKIQKLREALAEGLSQFENVTIFSSLNKNISAPHILTFGIKNLRGEVLVHAFEEKDIYLSTTSACSSKQKSSHSTLKAMGVAPKLAETAVRVSLSDKNTMAEVEQFLIIFNQLYQKFSKIHS
ncbi:cysteine desulfurase family protein [Vagococcus jeotgali]|uniref:cysteine desulfurase family protein n=1 Tax=Vagococcus jeotgali TaxID=3109030 RepID=UPI002DD98A66|nr:cysteine desulfurase family protein [Vagococcus sp. B2T-5]